MFCTLFWLYSEWLNLASQLSAPTRGRTAWSRDVVTNIVCCVQFRCVEVIPGDIPAEEDSDEDQAQDEQVLPCLQPLGLSKVNHVWLS
jgi:hypothetical protein